MIRYIDRTHRAGLWVAGLWSINTGSGEHPSGRPNPTHDGLVPNAHREDVQPTQVLSLPPVQRSFRISESRRDAPYGHGIKIPDIAIGNQVLDGAVYP